MGSKLKLKSEKLVLALIAAAVGGFLLGWTMKKGTYKLQRWLSGHTIVVSKERDSIEPVDVVLEKSPPPSAQY